MKNKIYYLYVALTLLLLADVIAQRYYKTSLAGIMSDEILFWTWVVTTLVLIIVYAKKRMRKWYWALLIFSFVITFPLWLVPFAYSDFMVTPKAVSGKYRAQLNDGFLHQPPLEIVERKGLLEEIIITDPCSFLFNRNLKIGYEPISEVKFIKVTTDSIILNVNTPWRKNLVKYKIPKTLN